MADGFSTLLRWVYFFGGCKCISFLYDTYAPYEERYWTKAQHENVYHYCPMKQDLYNMEQDLFNRAANISRLHHEVDSIIMSGRKGFPQEATEGYVWTRKELAEIVRSYGFNYRRMFK